MEVKTIGILTSGGDAPGMNAVIKSVVRSAHHSGIKVLGVMRGYSGLINNDFVEMGLKDVSGISSKGGTILYSARCLEFKEMAGVQKAKDNCVKAGIDGLVVIGGDGSFRGAGDLSSLGLPCVGIPGTIDNDIACTDYTIGYDTALNTAMEIIDKIRDTCESHDRCCVAELMGRDAGWIALNVGIACGASAYVLPEKGLNMDEIIAKLEAGKAAGKNNFLVVVGEGIGKSHEIAKEIEERTGIESRATILGHVQRGGSPTMTDRIVGSQMGAYAVDKLLKNGIGNRVIAQKDGKIVDYDIQEALKMKKHIPEELWDLANELAF